MAENGPREKVADLISNKLFSKFKWAQHGPFNQDFKCIHEDKHKPADKTQSHTHPVDLVFSYKDPYLNKTILLNTDLKSYGASSISPGMIEKSLSSLAYTIECASNSQEWINKYSICAGNFEVRGMLFVYNHDNKPVKSFYDFFYPPKPEGKGRRSRAVQLEKIKIPINKQIHFVDPDVIAYMMSVTSDMNEMIAEGTFPSKNYGFYYPQLTLHKVITSETYKPATIELICSPFMILEHDAVYEHDDHGTKKLKFEAGYVVYYNRSGEEDNEFVYLLDTLAKYQILNGKNKIRIRLAYKNKDSHVRSNFSRAIEKYAHEWSYDGVMTEYLQSIELHLVPTVKEFYCTESLSWEL
ncbi:hypothetical protein ORJ04_12255 [Rheinheimera baltica]|uniref:GAPS4 PD-(D/E)XK nuclease domain-containing protein n=1 Tax=Rheinheimera baltica TaxID=67576 RepID=A0ABT9I001_9GAMM|nr:hypothetical protein [Rheinheimera baltica]MDP5136721.1 hypothetical protein [Rheinheimera baltica]